MTRWAIGLAVVVLLCTGVALYAGFTPNLWRATVAPVQEQNAKTLDAIDKALADTGRDHAIAELARQTQELERQAAEARARRDAAEAEARRAATTAAQLLAKLDALETARRAQPAIRTLVEARDAIAGALR